MYSLRFVPEHTYDKTNSQNIHSNTAITRQRTIHNIVIFNALTAFIAAHDGRY